MSEPNTQDGKEERGRRVDVTEQDVAMVIAVLRVRHGEDSFPNDLYPTEEAKRASLRRVLADGWWPLNEYRAIADVATAAARRDVETVRKESTEAIVRLALCKIGREEAQRDRDSWRRTCEKLTHERNDALRAFEDARVVRWFEEWHEDDGLALWWHPPICEPPAFCGTPNDSDWPFTHEQAPGLVWMRVPNPATNAPTHARTLEPRGNCRAIPNSSQLRISSEPIPFGTSEEAPRG